MWWRQQGPCSNWGYDIYRLENNQECQKRIKKELKQQEKRKKFITKNKNKIQHLTKNFLENIKITNKSSRCSLKDLIK